MNSGSLGPSGATDRRICGIASGVFSGFSFALYSVLAAFAMKNPPLAGAVGFFTAPLAAAAINDSVSAFWLFLYNRQRGHRGILRTGFATKSGRLVILGAVLGGPLANSLFLAAMKSAGASLVLPFSALCPLFGCLFARLFLKQTISKKTGAGMGVCVLGAALVSLSGSRQTAGLSAAFFCALMAAAFWALDGICAAHAMKVLAPEEAIQIRQGVSGFVLLFLVMPLFRSWPLLAGTILSPLPATYLLASALFTALSYLNWYRANHLLGVAVGMSLNITYVFWGALLSVFLFRQLPGFWNVLGMLATIGGVTLIAFGQRRKQAAP
jgi:drug/metabolite transporter (DMT)-like permease